MPVVLHFSWNEQCSQNQSFFKNGPIIDTFKNYNPDLIVFGHSDNINENILNDFKSLNKNIIISQWNEDPLMNNLPDIVI